MPYRIKRERLMHIEDIYHISLHISYLMAASYGLVASIIVSGTIYFSRPLQLEFVFYCIITAILFLAGVFGFIWHATGRMVKEFFCIIPIIVGLICIDISYLTEIIVAVIRDEHIFMMSAGLFGLNIVLCAYLFTRFTEIKKILKQGHLNRLAATGQGISEGE